MNLLNKNIRLIPFMLLFSIGAAAQTTAGSITRPAVTGPADSTSIYLLNHMAEHLQGLQSLSVQINTSYDVLSPGLGLVKYGDIHQLKILFPNKLLIESKGDRGHNVWSYNKDRFNNYSFDENTLGTLKVSGTTVIEMIDELSRNYGIEFPAADLFYPDFVDDAIATSSQLSYLGHSVINGVSCFHIAAKTNEMSWQLWLSSDTSLLPIRLVIVYTKADGQPQYQADFSHWSINIPFSESLFNFTPIPGAKTIKIKAKQ